MVGRKQSEKAIAVAVLAAMASACERGEVVEETPVVSDTVEMTAPDAPEPAPEPVVRSGDPLTDDVAFLHKQGLISGHLLAFLQLYRIGEYDSAESHLVAPDGEAYAALAPAMEARGAAGYAGALAQLASAAKARSDIEEPYQRLVTEMSGAAPSVGVKITMLAVSEIIRSASAAFENGVGESGDVTNPADYQYGYGLVLAARNLLQGAGTDDISETEAIAVAHEQLDALEAGFHSFMAQETEGDAFLMKAAADVVERAALRLS